MRSGLHVASALIAGVAVCVTACRPAGHDGLTHAAVRTAAGARAGPWFALRMAASAPSATRAIQAKVRRWAAPDISRIEIQPFALAEDQEARPVSAESGAPAGPDEIPLIVTLRAPVNLDAPFQLGPLRPDLRYRVAARAYAPDGALISSAPSQSEVVIGPLTLAAGPEPIVIPLALAGSPFSGRLSVNLSLPGGSPHIRQVAVSLATMRAAGDIPAGPVQYLNASALPRTLVFAGLEPLTSYRVRAEALAGSGQVLSSSQIQVDVTDDDRPADVSLAVPAGMVATLAGASAGLSDGVGSAARFGNLGGIAVNRDSRAYLADTGNHRIRAARSVVIGSPLLDPAPRIHTLAGSEPGFADGFGSQAQFRRPIGLALDHDENLIVADAGNHAIRRVTPDGRVTTVAGLGTAGSEDGPPGVARFNAPEAVAMNSDGSVLVADTGNHRIRLISPGGEVSTLAGGPAGFADGPGAAARFHEPRGLALDRDGSLLVADSRNRRIRRVSSAGAVMTVAGSGAAGSADGPGALATFAEPCALAADARGDTWVADCAGGPVRVLSSGGSVSTLAGSAGGQADGVGTSAAFSVVRGLAITPAGDLWLTDGTRLRALAHGPPGLAPAWLPDLADPRPAPGSPTLPVFSKPFAGDWPAWTYMDHDLPFEFVDRNGFVLTWWNAAIAGMTDGHYGYDWATPEGTPILAVADGVVNYSQASEPYFCPPLGATVTDELGVGIRHVLASGEQLQTLFLHLSALYVGVGATVQAGQTIGLAGNTGCSLGAHLHFSVSRPRPDDADYPYTLVDPYGWAGANGTDPWTLHPQGTASVWLWRPGLAPGLEAAAPWGLLLNGARAVQSVAFSPATRGRDHPVWVGMGP